MINYVQTLSNGMLTFSFVDSTLLQICTQNLLQVSFSSCGNYLFGYRLAKYPKLSEYGLYEETNVNEPDKGKPEIFSIVHLLGELLLEIMPPAEREHTALAQLHSPKTLQTSLPRESSPRRSGKGVTSEMVSFQVDGGHTEMSILGRNEDGHSLLRQTLHDDGRLLKETLFQLPRSLQSDSLRATIVDSPTPSSVRVVLDKAAQNSYDFLDPEARSSPLPAVVDRNAASIPQAVGHMGTPSRTQLEPQRHSWAGKQPQNTSQTESQLSTGAFDTLPNNLQAFFDNEDLSIEILGLPLPSEGIEAHMRQGSYTIDSDNDSEFGSGFDSDSDSPERRRQVYASYTKPK